MSNRFETGERYPSQRFTLTIDRWMFLFAVRKLAQAHNRTKNLRRTIPGTNLSLKCSVVVVHSIIVLLGPQGSVSALDAMQATRHSQGTCEKNEGVDMLTGRGYPAMKA
ncbi:hypothetical protein SNK05_007946 [Fusarium graminearum]